MEIDAHRSRVTSLSVTVGGQVLASGDENGTIRLLLLRQLDMFNIRPSRRYQTTTAGGVGSSGSSIYDHSIPTLPQEGRKAFVAHASGPVFALQWLPVGIGSIHKRSYVLCSGSTDAGVKLWHVLATVEGLVVAPLLHLDTQSSNILCLHSYFLDTTAMSRQLCAQSGNEPPAVRGRGLRTV